MRIIFFSGKGGVGKTSVAAATGIKAAQLGYKTVIMSLDTAHSLADIFDLSTGLLDQNKGQPIEVEKNLWIQELDIQEEIEKNWGTIHGYLSHLLNTTGIDEILAEEFAILPGMEEVSLLLYINQYARQNQFDVILLDCAPTGESIRFISIPGTLEWYMKKLFKLERTIVKYIRPVAKKVLDVPLPDDDYFKSIESLFERLKGVDALLVDPDITTVRLITNPEKIVLKETQRAFMYFSLYKMNIDAIIMNRILPKTVVDDYFTDWRESQKTYIKQANELFDPIPIIPVNLFKDEILGLDRLEELAVQLYNDKDPIDHFFKGEPYELIKQDKDYCLKMNLPFIDKQSIDLSKTGEELIVRIGSFKKNILLPRQVAASKSIQAKIEANQLCIYFKGNDVQGEQDG